MSHQVHHLARQPWWCGWHLSEAGGHTEYSRPPSCLYCCYCSKTEGVGGFRTQPGQTTFTVCFTMIRMPTKVEKGKVGKSAPQGASPFIVLHGTILRIHPVISIITGYFLTSYVFNNYSSPLLCLGDTFQDP